MKNKLHPFIGLILLLVSLTIIAHTPPPGARVFFIGIEDGAVVDSPFKVKFGIEGFGITPAGTKGKIRHQAGHHHLLINVDKMPALDKPLPSDENHRHFGGGQTEVTLELPKGEHSLQLVLGDMNHLPFNPPVISEKITITVK